MKRPLFGTLLTLGLAMLGFMLGGVLAAEFFVPPDAGMAGGATVALSGFGGALIGLVAGVLLAFRLAPSILLPAAVVALLAGVASIMFVGVQRVERQDTRAAETAAVTPAPGPDVQTLPPPLPPPGTSNPLLGLLTVPPEALPRFETREHTYEEKSVTVYGKQGNWYLVGLSEGGRAWMDMGTTGRYFPLEELVMNRLNWLTEAWDTRLREAPDLKAPATEVPVPPSVGKEVPAKVLEARRDGDMLWFKVEVLEQSPCEGGTPPVVASGWIPAWDKEGKPTAWFYSRGC